MTMPGLKQEEQLGARQGVVQRVVTRITETPVAPLFTLWRV